MDKQKVLKKYFGYSQFRQGQETLIDGILSGRDVLGILPTGGGKSLCYQLPALMLPGITLVISPLISLMKDQVAALKEAGIPAAYINSSLSLTQMRTVYQRMEQGAYRILYVAPERLQDPNFVALLHELNVALFAVDEAHCISQWGQDFRPSYLMLTEILAKLPHRPVVAAFTATATELVQQDIVTLLGLKNCIRVVTGFDRPNLFFGVQRPSNKKDGLLELIRERQGRSGIVYCSTRKDVEAVCQTLIDQGYSATRYHAGLDPEERKENQEAFQYDRKQIMVATNAFGMGIDKSNVSFVIHYNMPKDLESYYQEAGRAGRDGSPADCILLYSSNDVRTARFLIQNSEENERISPEDRERIRQQDLRRLEAMVNYCKTTHCLRGAILDYFGQEHPARCENCSTCLAEYVEMDITIPAQMILSCILRVKKHLGYYVGITLIVHTLYGSQGQREKELRLDKLSTYGLMHDKKRTGIRTYIDLLIRADYLWVNPAHQTLEPTEKARAVLYGGEKVLVTVPAEEEKKQKAPKPKKSSAAHPMEVEMENEALLSALRKERTRLAQLENVPAYIVFSNATLADMANKCPTTLDELMDVSGVGNVKAEKYGKQFLRVIKSYLEG
jgi:ATP-dependent DNA helicase RecQ